MKGKKTESNKKKKTAAIVLSAAALLAALLAALYFFVFCDKPLSEAIIGKWTYSQNGADLVKASVGKILGDADIKEITNAVPDEITIRAHLSFRKNGEFSLSVDGDDFKSAMIDSIDAMSKYFTSNQDEFFKIPGISSSDNENISDLSDGEITEYIKNVFERVKAKFSDLKYSFRVNGDGDIISINGKYRVEGDRVMISFEAADGSSAQDEYFIVEASRSKLTIKENYSSLPFPNDTVLEK